MKASDKAGSCREMARLRDLGYKDSDTLDKIAEYISTHDTWPNIAFHFL